MSRGNVAIFFKVLESLHSNNVRLASTPMSHWVQYQLDLLRNAILFSAIKMVTFNDSFSGYIAVISKEILLDQAEHQIIKSNRQYA